MPKVSTDGHLVAYFMRSIIMERVVDNINAGRHKNHDFTWPDGARWNVDDSTRHTMETGMTASGTTSGDTATVTLRLTYTVRDI